VIITQKRNHLELQVAREPLNYDYWFDYCTLEEQSSSNDARSRAVYERAVANVPPASEKRFWKRYIYLWINYALFEENAADASGDSS